MKKCGDKKFNISYQHWAAAVVVEWRVECLHFVPGEIGDKPLEKYFYHWTYLRGHWSVTLYCVPAVLPTLSATLSDVRRHPRSRCEGRVSVMAVMSYHQIQQQWWQQCPGQMSGISCKMEPGLVARAPALSQQKTTCPAPLSHLVPHPGANGHLQSQIGKLNPAFNQI